jgi:hypothetical protein
MRKFLTTIFFTLLLSFCATAENVVVGDKLPKLSIRQWLMDSQPSDAEYTCYLFYHSHSELCQQSIDKIKQYISERKLSLNVIIITKEAYNNAGVKLTRYLNDHTGVAFDDNGRTFRYFGVKYIPFCVVSHKKRVIWCGNGNSLSNNILDNILTK